jgi:hypothetical protein
MQPIQNTVWNTEAASEIHHHQNNKVVLPILGKHKVNSLVFCGYIYLVGGAITILKNDGVRQWEGLSHILWNIKNV